MLCLITGAVSSNRRWRCGVCVCVCGSHRGSWLDAFAYAVDGAMRVWNLVFTFPPLLLTHPAASVCSLCCRIPLHKSFCLIHFSHQNIKPRYAASARSAFRVCSLNLTTDRTLHELRNVISETLLQVNCANCASWSHNDPTRLRDPVCDNFCTSVHVFLQTAWNLCVLFPFCLWARRKVFMKHSRLLFGWIEARNSVFLCISMKLNTMNATYFPQKGAKVFVSLASIKKSCIL